MRQYEPEVGRSKSARQLELSSSERKELEQLRALYSKDHSPSTIADAQNQPPVAASPPSIAADQTAQVAEKPKKIPDHPNQVAPSSPCLLYTSDAADDM
eukprot:603242-Rhodomonas_salina.1